MRFFRAPMGVWSDLWFCLPVVCIVLAVSARYLYVLDFSMLSVVVVCAMPGLCLLDVVTLLVLTWAGIRKIDADNEARSLRRRRLRYTGCLLILHLVTAALSCVLLVIPARSIWVGGVTIVFLRLVESALALTGFLLSLGLIRVMIRTLLAILKHADEADGTGEKAQEDGFVLMQ